MTNCYQQFFYFGEFTQNTITNITNNTSEIKEITLSELITAIGAYAFEKLDNLYKITIGRNIQSIHSNAFQNCPSIIVLTIPKGTDIILLSNDIVESITNTHINIINYNRSDSNTTIDNIFGNINGGNISINYILDISETYFEMVDGNYIYIDQSGVLTQNSTNFYIGFNINNPLENISININEISQINIGDKITQLGGSSFSPDRDGDNYNTSTVIVSNNLEIVGDSAFEGNKIRYFNIRDIENSKLSVIGQSSFAYTALNTIIFPDSLESIGYNAFHGANHGFPYYLRVIKFNDISKSNLGGIGRDSFRYAYNNVFKDIYIEIPEKISIIHPNAYIDNWNYYKNVNFYGPRPIFQGYSWIYGGYGPFVDGINNETNISYGADICMGTFILGNPYNQSYQYAYLYHTVPNIIFDFSYRELWDPINSIDGYQVMPNYNENYPEKTVFRLRNGSYVYLDQSGTLSCNRKEVYIKDGVPNAGYGGYISYYDVIPYDSTADISYEISYNDIAVIYIGKNINTISDECFLDYIHDYTDQIVNIYITPDVSCIGSNNNVFSGHSSRNYNFLNINSSKLTTLADRSMLGDINKIIIPPSVEYIGNETFHTRADKSIICIQFSDINNSKLHTIGEYCFKYLFNPEPDPPIDNISDLHFSKTLKLIDIAAFSECGGFTKRLFFYGERPQLGNNITSYSNSNNNPVTNNNTSGNVVTSTTIEDIVFDFSNNSNVKFFYNKQYGYSWDMLDSIDGYPLFPFIPGYDFSGYYNSNQENIEISGNIKYIGPGAFAHNRNFTKDVFFHGECPEIFTINGIQNFQQNIIDQRIKANIDIFNTWYNYYDTTSSEYNNLHANDSRLLYSSVNTFWKNFNNARNIYTNFDLSLGYNSETQISTFSPVFDFMSYDNIKNGEATNILFDFSNTTVRKSWDLIASIDGYPVMPNFNENYPERTVFRLHDGSYVFLAEPSSNTILQNNGQTQVYQDSANNILDSFNKFDPINYYNNTGEIGSCSIFNVIDLSYGYNISDSSINDLSYVILASDIATCYVGKNITQIGENAFQHKFWSWQNPPSTIFYIPPYVTDFSRGCFGGEYNLFFDIVIYFLDISNSQFKNFSVAPLHNNIKNLVIPKLVSRLDVNALYGLGNQNNSYRNTGTLKIHSHDIKNSKLTFIGVYAFQYALNRSGNIYISSKVETIDIEAFVYCTGFQAKMFFLGPRPSLNTTLSNEDVSGILSTNVFNLHGDAEIIYMYENRESWENITSIDGIMVRLYDESIDGDNHNIQYSDNGIYELSSSS